MTDSEHSINTHSTSPGVLGGEGSAPSSPVFSMNRGRTRSLSFAQDSGLSIKYSLQHRFRGRLNIIKKKPLLLLPCFLVFAVISVLGVLGVIFYIQFRDEDSSDNMLDRLDDSVQQIVSVLASAAGGASAMAVYTETIIAGRRSNASIPDRFEDGFEAASQSILERSVPCILCCFYAAFQTFILCVSHIRWTASTALFVDPNGIFTYAYPSLFLNNLPSGFDFFLFSRNVSFEDAIDLPVFFTGPHTHAGIYGGGRYLHTFVPIWVPATSNETDFGYGVRDDCPLCYNAATGQMFFGAARSILSLGALLGTSPIHALIADGLKITVRQRPLPPRDVNSISEEIVFSSSTYENVCELNDVTFVNVDAFNLKWEVCAQTGGFEPFWIEYAIAGCILAAVVLSVLFLALLVERNHGNVILEEILPRDVIGHLKKGVGPYSEKYDNVTILFCDIVGFTSLSSSLTPTQVVNMLDDLYTKFDKLSEKHGVYKVETIGNNQNYITSIRLTSSEYFES